MVPVFPLFQHLLPSLHEPEKSSTEAMFIRLPIALLQQFSLGNWSIFVLFWLFAHDCLSQDIFVLMTLFSYKYIFTGRKRSHLQFHLFKIQRKQSVPTCCGRWGYWRLLSHDHGFDFKWRMRWWWMDADHEDWWQSGSWLTLSMVTFSFQFLILNVSEFPFLCKITVSTLLIYKNKLIAETHLSL